MSSPFRAKGIRRRRVEIGESWLRFWRNGRCRHRFGAKGLRRRRVEIGESWLRFWSKGKNGGVGRRCASLVIMNVANEK